MLRSDLVISENAQAFCLSMKPNSQEFLKPNFPEFDASNSVTVVIPNDADEALVRSLDVCHCERLEIVKASPENGLLKAGGDFIVFLEKGDVVEPDMFRMLLRRLILSRASVACCGFFGKNGKVYSPKGLAGILTPAVAASAPLCLSGFMFKTEYLRGRAVGEKITSSNPYFYIAALRKIELVTVNSPLLHTRFVEKRTFEEIYGNEEQAKQNPLVWYYKKCIKYSPFGKKR